MMRRLHNIMLILVLGGLLPAGAPYAAAATPEPAHIEQQFAEAKAAYDEERLADAIAIYEGLWQSGHVSEALFFNLANAHFRSGHLGPAVLHYKRALQLAPRDPDARANLGFALDTAGAGEPPLTVYARFCRKLTLSEWVAVALFGYWFAALGLGALLWWPRFRAPLVRCALTGGLLAAVGLGGGLYAHQLRRMPEVVVMQPNQEVRFAPLQGATAHFEAPEGTVLRLVDSVEGWYKVRSGKQAGWIPAAVCARVYPWQGTSGRDG